MEKSTEYIGNDTIKSYYSLDNKNIILKEALFDWKSFYEFRKILILVIKDIKSEYPNVDDFLLNFSGNPIIKKRIVDIVSENIPLLRILRLSKWDDLVNFSFWWIKKINDSYWDKSSIDVCLNKIKKYIRSKFSEYSSRLIRKNYKNLTIDYKTPDKHYSSGEIIEFLWIWKEKIDLLIKSLLSWEDQNLVELIINNLAISSWVSFVEWDSLEDKLFAFYSSEINSRMNWEYFKFSWLVSKSKDIVSQEWELISKFWDKSFELSWAYHKVFVQDDVNFWWINPILIEAVRKNEPIWDEHLFSLVKKYIDSLNFFDFIAPYVNLNNDFEEIYKEIKELESLIQKWVAYLSFVDTNYKWTLNRTALIEYSKWVEGLRVFIDIASMGIMNFSEFREIARKISSWEITESNKYELFNSGMETTIKFKNFVENLQRKYPNIKLSLWWDEVFIFVPSTEWIEKEEVLDSIWECLKMEGLNWRSVFSYKNDEQEKLYNDLDNISFISKKIEKLIRKFTPNFVWMPDLVKVDIPDWIRSYILSKSWEYEKELSRFLSNFEEKTLSQEWYSEKVRELTNYVCTEVKDILWDSVPIFIFLPEWHTTVRHYYYFKITNWNIQISIRSN